MRPAAVILAVILAAVLAATATVPAAEAVPRANVRVLLQFIELPHPALTELMAGTDTSGQTLHASAMALVGSGRAKVLESAVLTARNGQGGRVESIREVIYPWHYDLPCNEGISDQEYFRKASEPFNNRTPCAWDTRMVGVTVAVTPSIASDGRSIGLVLHPEIVKHAGERTWNSWLGPHGRYDIRMPDFRALRANLDVTLVPGRFEMVTVLNPAPAAPAPAVFRKVLVFVRADLLPGSAPRAR
jgi:hypothetical protein